MNQYGQMSDSFREIIREEKQRERTTSDSYELDGINNFYTRCSDEL